MVQSAEAQRPILIVVQESSPVQDLDANKLARPKGGCRVALTTKWQPSLFMSPRTFRHDRIGQINGRPGKASESWYPSGIKAPNVRPGVPVSSA